MKTIFVKGQVVHNFLHVQDPLHGADHARGYATKYCSKPEKETVFY